VIARSAAVVARVEPSITVTLSLVLPLFTPIAKALVGEAK